MANCLTNRQVSRWVTPQGWAEHRRQFVPADFVRHGGTLYSLSKEGRGNAGPLMTALTVAIVRAAETLASTSPAGRLTVPLLGVLDEAANVCRWRELPNLYSHYGSRGIILMTILQSWSQGVDVWGESGMRRLWSASNIAVARMGTPAPGPRTRYVCLAARSLAPAPGRAHEPCRPVRHHLGFRRCGIVAAL